MTRKLYTGILSCVAMTSTLGFVSSAALAAEGTPVSQSKTAADLLPSDLLQISNTDAFSKYVFLVDKSERHLQVYERKGETIEKILDVPSDMGKALGNKTKRDDYRTPEGIYFFEKKLNQPEIPFSLYGELAFTTDYPNIFDRRESKTGSGIWLHAVPDTVPLTRGSRGCVVVRNDVIKKLQDYIKLKETPILIFDKVSYVSKEEHDKRRVSLNEFIEGWRKAWQSQDIEEYMKFYDEKFKAPGFDFAGWKAHKSKLKKQYEFIKVQLSQPFLLLHKDQLIVRTFQRYESNNHTDFGIKTLYAVKVDSGYKIIREEWTPVRENISNTASTTATPQTANPNN